VLHQVLDLNAKTAKKGRNATQGITAVRSLRKPLRTLRLIFSCLVLIFVAGAGDAARAQNFDRGWEWQNPLPQGNAISAVRFANDKRHGWAVGANGVILYTADGGFEWTSQHTRLVASLNGLYVFDRQHAFAVGARGVVLATRNGGEKWTEIPTPRKIICTRLLSRPTMRNMAGRSALTVASSPRLMAAKPGPCRRVRPARISIQFRS